MGKLVHALKETVSFITVLLFLIMFLTGLGLMYYGLWYLPQYIDLPRFAVPIYYLNPLPVLLFWLTGTYAYVWYVFLTIIISISAILLFYFHGVRYFQKFVSEPFSYKRNGLQEFVELYSLILFIDLIIILVMYAAHYKPSNPISGNNPTYSLMLALLHASVYEEFLVRFLLLGVPVFLWRYLQTKNSKTKINPLRVFGGGYKFGVPEITFLLISSSIFALAHVPSWGWWKLAPTFIGGLALGYLYLKYGLHLAILFHFASDFMNLPMLVDNALQIPFGIVLLVIMMAGIVFTISYIIRLLQFFGLMKPKQQNVQLPPPPPWINVRCPNCGSTHFIYLGNNEYKCISCGTVFKAKNDDQTQIA